MPLEKWWYVRSILKYGSPLISLLEKPLVRRYSRHDPEYPPVFIIGPPRSGSTILYQMITAALEVAYFDNLANMARKNPFVGMSLSRRIFGDKTHSSFSSAFGNTSRGGLHAPAEALFFYQWFPKDRHYTTESDLDEKQKKAFRDTVWSMIRASHKALVIKNLSFSMRLQVLSKVFPNARYIVLRRNPLFTVQSILLAMRKSGTSEGIWSIRPKNFVDLGGLEIHERVVQQVNQIEMQILNDLQQIPQDQVIFIDYLSLGEHPDRVLQVVGRLCEAQQKQVAINWKDTVNPVNRIQLPKEEIRLIESHIAALDWPLQKL